MLDHGLSRTPAGRLTQPEDIAKVVAFLCSPDAYMIRGQTIMVDAEKRRHTVSLEEIDRTRAVLQEAKAPSPRNPRHADEGQESEFACLRCGHAWTQPYRTNTERICPQCRSNSIRWLRVLQPVTA